MSDASSRPPGVDPTLLEETAEDLYEHAPSAYLSTLPDGLVVRVNQTLVDWTGTPRETWMGTRFQSRLTIGSRIYYETHYAPLLRMQGFVNELAVDVVRDDGRILPVLLNARQRRDASGTPLFNRITLFDATDRRRYERELLLARRKAEQIAKDKADLLNMLSHDIRNPLNAMMGVVQLLDRSDLTDRQRGFLRLLRSSSDNMLTLLNRVLELSRAESNTVALEEMSMSVRTIVEEVVATFQTPARGKELQLHASVAETVPLSVMGDPIALRQILSNLVGNAVKFTEKGGVDVRVETREFSTDAVTLRFAVTDTGIGIPREALERIFNEFSQASYDTALQYGGSGLGLAITRKLLARYGSAVRVDSAPGAGSTFSFDLRLALPA